MTRRFFPARSAQAIPGGSVDMALKMTPAAAPVDCPPATVYDTGGTVLAELDCGETFVCPAGAGGGCDVTSVEWLAGQYPYSNFGEEDVYYRFPDTNPEIDPTLVSVYAPNSTTWGGGSDSPRYLYGAPIGPNAGGVTWEFAWGEFVVEFGTAPETPVGTVETIGPMLKVTLTPLPLDGGSQWNITLTATAYCGGLAIGTLSLKVETLAF